MFNVAILIVADLFVMACMMEQLGATMIFFLLSVDSSVPDRKALVQVHSSSGKRYRGSRWSYRGMH